MGQIDRIEKKLEKKFLSALNDPKSVRVDYHKNYVSNNPVFSLDYYECVGVAVLGDDGFCGLSHYRHPSAFNISEQMQIMLERLKDVSKFDEFEYFVTGGDREHIDMINDTMEKLRVQKIGEFCDRDYLGRQVQKSIAVIPKTREVILQYNDTAPSYMILAGYSYSFTRYLHLVSPLD